MSTKLKDAPMDDSHFKIQAERFKTLTVPWLLAVNMIELSLFQHTALMKKGPISSSGSSKSGEPNLCHVTGFGSSCK